MMQILFFPVVLFSKGDRTRGRPVEWPLLVLVASLLVACSPPSSTPAREKTAQATVEPAPAREAVTVSLAVYSKLSGKELAAVASPSVLAKAMIADCSDDCDSLKETLAVPKALAVTIGTTRDLPPPGFFFSSESIGKKERNRLKSLPAVTMIGVTGSPSSPYPALRAATDAARILAGKVDGLVFDPASYLLSTAGDVTFSKPAREALPWSQLELGLLELDRGMRAVTFGMAKFGRPDLVVSRIPKSELPLVVAALGAAAAKLMGAEESDRLAISSSDLRNGAKDGSLSRELREGTFKIRLKAAPRRPSDPVNRLVELVPFEDEDVGLASALALVFAVQGEPGGVGGAAPSR